MTLKTRTITSSPQVQFNAPLLRQLFALAVPITLQSIFFSSKGVIDLIMIGQLSENDIAAAGVSSRALFVATIILSGVTTAGAILIAQYFGKKDNQGTKRSTALTWLLSSLLALVPFGVLALTNSQVMGLSSNNVEVQDLGSQYLFITSFSLFCVAFTGSIAAYLRSVHQASISLYLSSIGIILNILLNWILIFGHFGAPQMGLKGAAVATLISSLIEVAITIIYLKLNKNVVLFNLSDIRQALRLSHIKQLTRLALPTTINFALWAGGLFAYTSIMGRSSDEGLIVLSIITPIEAFSLSFLIGIANASAVIVGNHIGAKDFDSAYRHAILITVIAFTVTLCVSLSLYALKDTILGLFTSLEATTIELANKFYGILCIGIILRSLPTTMVVGVLRAGGDVKFCLYQDLITQWCFGIPLAAIGALLMGLSPEWVFALFFLETLFKWFACIYRFRSKRWFNYLAQ
ncbi:MATE family efflux transporter [Vibrio sp. Isolate31]|uniref:MATE family efflux transporter n=1 Tax=unclassified Vibrio TaxID=2614977 RepID=UPI001EFCC014|nr:MULTISPECIES: MATE family efflux transporter [unclassified Vibrio]MCG9553027.1 MATE family efflux transporter [Vibrio sp. Isolate32]MCG9602436.1 MATE family efflux transporter [Vibrio sp. Isolate31]